jgi:hypothetical protein
MSNFFRLDDFIDKEKDKTAFVCGMGPSLSDYIDRINKEDCVKVACSDVDLMTNIIPDYWVFANSMNSAVAMNERWKKMETSIIVHADSVDVTSNKWIIENVKNKYIGYDQRHFDNKTCSCCPNGCANFVEGRKTIQELLRDYSGIDEKYNTGHTVALHCLALAILLGCNKIFLCGIDLDYTLGYVDKKTFNGDSFIPWLPEILDDFRIIKKSSENLGIEIYNTSQNSPLKEIFNTVIDF